MYKRGKKVKIYMPNGIMKGVGMRSPWVEGIVLGSDTTYGGSSYNLPSYKVLGYDGKVYNWIPKIGDQVHG